MAEQNAAQTISDALDKVLRDPDTVRAINNLDQVQFQAALATSCQSVATYLNFESYKRSLQLLKSRLSRLDDKTEALYVERLHHTIEAYRACVSAAETMSQLFTSSGIDTVFARYKETLFKLTPVHPYTGQVTRSLSAMGATDADIAHCSTWLRANKWDPFRLPGSDGTFAGAVESIKRQLPALEAELSAAKSHGLPVIEGNDLGTIIVIVVVVGGMVVCIAATPKCTLTF